MRAAPRNIHRAHEMMGDFDRAFNVKFDLEPTGVDVFDGTIDVHDFGRMKVAHLVIAPHRTRRAHVARPSGSAPLLFNRQVSGKLVVHQDGRSAEIGPGDMYLLNPARDFELDTEAIVAHTIAIDATLVRGVFPEAECCAALRLPNEGAPVMFSSVIDGLVKWAPTLNKSVQAQMTEATPHLMAAALSEGLKIAEACPPRLRALHKERIKAFGRDHLADPNLSCAMISDALHLSERYIYKVLEDEPVTLMQGLRRARLVRCRMELASPALRHRSIGEIAYSWGFSDLAHFSRAFKAQFGQSPRAFRRTSLAQQAQLEAGDGLGPGAPTS